MNVLLITPTSDEFIKMKSAIKQFSNLKNKYFTLLSGVGKTESSFSLALQLNKTKYDLVALVGYAGGSTSFKQGDLVFPNSTKFYDVNLPIEFSDLPMNQSFQLQGPDEVLLLSGDSFVSSNDSDILQSEYGSQIIYDMESTSCAIVCQEFNVPFLVMKIISDIPEDTSTSYNNYIKEHNDFKPFINYIESIV